MNFADASRHGCPPRSRAEINAGALTVFAGKLTVFVGKAEVLALLDASQQLGDFCQKYLGKNFPKRKSRPFLQKMLVARAAVMRDLLDEFR